MSRRQYPCLGGTGKLKERPGLKGETACAACDLPPTHYVDVQVSWFRGDDDVVAVCLDHRKLAERQFQAFNRLCGFVYERRHGGTSHEPVV